MRITWPEIRRKRPGLVCKFFIFDRACAAQKIYYCGRDQKRGFNTRDGRRPPQISCLTSSRFFTFLCLVECPRCLHLSVGDLINLHSSAPFFVLTSVVNHAVLLRPKRAQGSLSERESGQGQGHGGVSQVVS